MYVCIYGCTKRSKIIMFFARNDRIGLMMIKILKSPPYNIFSNSKKILNMEREGGKDFNLPLILGTAVKIYVLCLFAYTFNSAIIRESETHTHIHKFTKPQIHIRDLKG